jgi:hypothetical protein
MHLVQRGASGHHLLVHVDLAALSHDTDGRCHLRDGPYLSPEVARRLGCDASLTPVGKSPAGEVLSVGRKTRAIPPSIKTALESRDKGCRFPGCNNRRFLDGHHVRHWAHGGETSLDNLLLLCRTHHRLVHEGGFSVSLDAKGNPTFRRPSGDAVPASPTGTRGDPSGLPPGSGYLTGSGERYDLGMAVDWVLAVEARAASTRA